MAYALTVSNTDRFQNITSVVPKFFDHLFKGDFNRNASVSHVYVS